MLEEDVKIESLTETYSPRIMAFLHPMSCECLKSELDLFSVPPTQTSIIAGQWVEYQPLSSLSTSGPIEFSISGSGEDYVDFSQSWLLLEAKVTKPDGSNLGANTAIAPVNNWLHSLFSQIDLSLNDTMVTTANNTYAYRSYLESLLTFGSDSKESQLTSELFYADTVDKFDNPPTVANAGVNKGQDTRRKYVAVSSSVEMIGRLHLDAFNQPKLLLNGVDMRIRLNRSKNTFHLQYDPADGGFETQISKATLYIRKVKLNPKVQMAHIKALEKGTAKYPLRRVETKTFSVPAGNLQATQPNLFLGQRPKRLVIGLVDNDAFNGVPGKSPFNFKHYDMNYLAVYVDGTQVPTRPYTPDFNQKGGNMRSFLTLFHGTSKLGMDGGNCISRSDYAGNGFALHVLDLSPDLSDGNHLELREKGTVGLEIRFGTALPNTINVIVYSEFENLIEIDRNRRVIFDYAN